MDCRAQGFVEALSGGTMLDGVWGKKYFLGESNILMLVKPGQNGPAFEMILCEG